MPVYEYTALDAKGKTTAGIIDADGARAARQKLRATGIFPVAIKESQEAPVKKASRSLDMSRYLTRVKPAEIAIMTRQLSTLISAGFPLVSAIDALVPQTKSHRLKTILAQVKDAIVEGQNFAQALSQYPGIFSPLFIVKLNPLRTSLLVPGYRNDTLLNSIIGGCGFLLIGFGDLDSETFLLVSRNLKNRSRCLFRAEMLEY